MNKGELALFTLPSSLGYGESGAQGVPPGADIQFEVELISWIAVVDIWDLDEVTVKYQVMLQDGSVVAKSPEVGLELYINEGLLCSALPKVVKTMRRGERAVVTVQPQYAFGEQGRDAEDGFPSIPPNAILNIDIELVSLKPVVDVTGDMKVIKKILRAGEGTRRPRDGETVQIRCIGMLEDGTVFEKLGFDGGLFEFILDEEQVTAGLDRAVVTMLKGELSQLRRIY
uniref:peptidylprolyl isomerase n=1 Tax=Ananas comosus var. bracteatus TaxID=296719 RepID=A0A6V7NPT5_ANACO|nr:unnamed protein product [Ananas comosus var. bracteatus]